MTISVIMYKNLGISNTDIALYTSWLYLPWVIKPFWSPFVDLLKTKRWWIVSMQLLVGAGLAGIAFTIPMSNFFQTTLAIFWLVAFSSATHDIAADGFYMLALNVQDQALYVGIRSTFYRIATIAGQGLLVMLAGGLEIWTGSIKYGWSITFFILAGLFLAFCLYHKCILPKPDSDKAVVGENSASAIFSGFIETFASFFRKKQAGVAILFMLFYRFPEAQLVKLINPFLLDPIDKGGLGLTTAEVGLVYGTIGIIGADLGRHYRRYLCSKRRTSKVALANGMEPFIDLSHLCISRLLPTTKFCDNQPMCIYRAVRLWLRVHSLHALPHLLLRW